MKCKGIKLKEKDIVKIWGWTKNDTENLSVIFETNSPEKPTNGYAIFLMSLFDIWGSIIREKFGDECSKKYTEKNIKEILDRLFELNFNDYQIKNNEGKFKEDIVKTLRHNLIHQYGLKNLSSNKTEQHLNIDCNSNKPVIFQQDNGRWHIDCIRLKDDFLTIIDKWLKKEKIL